MALRWCRRWRRRWVALGFGSAAPARGGDRRRLGLGLRVGRGRCGRLGRRCEVPDESAVTPATTAGPPPRPGRQRARAEATAGARGAGAARPARPAPTAAARRPALGTTGAVSAACWRRTDSAIAATARGSRAGGGGRARRGMGPSPGRASSTRTAEHASVSGRRGAMSESRARTTIAPTRSSGHAEHAGDLVRGQLAVLGQQQRGALVHGQAGRGRAAPPRGAARAPARSIAMQRLRAIAYSQGRTSTGSSLRSRACRASWKVSRTASSASSRDPSMCRQKDRSPRWWRS